MKSKYLFFCLIAVLLMACNEDEPLTEQPIPDGEDAAGTGNPLKMENPYYWWAKDFPGDVADSVMRLQNAEVVLDGNYRNWQHLKINVAPSAPVVSTGLYVPVAEKVVIDVPEGITGLKYQIGIYHCVLPEDEPRKRFTNIVKKGELQPGLNEVFNYFGGHLYISFSVPLAQPFTLKVSGAVKSPDYILGETDPQGWKQDIAVTGVPWAEMRCDRMILTMPVSELRKVNDPEALMKFYQEFVAEDYNKYAGMTDEAGIHQAPAFPWRYVVDKQLCAGAGHNGYPFVGGLDWAESALSLTKLQEGDWGTFHELGHNYQTNTWKWSALGEVSNNLHVYHMMNRRFGKMHPREIESEGAVKYYLSGDEPAMATWDFDTLCNQKVFWGLVPFLQVAQEYGWPFYAYLAREGRENGNLGNDQAKCDFFARKLTEYADADLSPFFDAWRIAITPLTRAYMAQYPEVDEKFWNTFDPSVAGGFDERTPVKKDEPQASDHDADRSAWIAVASSQRPANPASAILDGTNTTFWQSDWTGGNGGNRYPHHIITDMQEVTVFNYVYLQHSAKQAQDNCARKIQISISDDKNNWTVVKSGTKPYFYLTATRDRQTFYLPEMTARYIRVDLIAPQPKSGEASEEEGQLFAVSMGEFGVGMFE